ncbi:MAG: hypothetical protein C4551_10000 [Bacillota bacterium]|nr:MAG: hypothetical protein C4551_10000 [Bacillota bacterium]
MVSGRTRRLAAVVVLAALAAGGRVTPAQAEPPATGVTGDCLECHGEPLTAEAGGRPVDLMVDPDRYAASAHGDLGCSLCHRPPVHVSLEQARAAALDACDTCHENHDFGPAGTSRPGFFVHPDPPLGCAGCHGDIHAVRPRDDSSSVLNGANITGFCGPCHREQTDAYLYSYHGSARRLGSRHAPDCGDCHGHLPPVSLDPQVPTSREGEATCLACHRGGAAALANLQETGREHVTPLTTGAGLDGLARRAVWKLFLAVIFFNVTKDGAVIVFDLTRRLRRAGRRE